MRNKRLPAVFLSVILVVVLSFASLAFMTGCTEETTPTPTPSISQAKPTLSPTPVETIQLKWLYTNTGAPLPGNWNHTWSQKFITEVDQLSGGRVKFIDMVGAVTAEGMYSSLIAGAGDIATNTVLLNTGRFPSLEIANVPGLFNYCWRPGEACRDMYKEFPEIQNEFSETKIIAIYSTTPSPPPPSPWGIGFATVSKPVYTLEDAKGMKIGNSGVWSQKVTNALGFTGVSVPNYANYENLQRKIVDGCFFDFNMIESQKLGEVIKYWHPVCRGYCPFWLAMNWDTWNSLPPDIQKIIEDVGANVAEWSDDALISYGERLNTGIPKLYPNLEYVFFTEEEKTKWEAAAQPIVLEYRDMLEKKGIDGKKIYDRMMQLLEKYNYK